MPINSKSITSAIWDANSNPNNPNHHNSNFLHHIHHYNHNHNINNHIPDAINIGSKFSNAITTPNYTLIIHPIRDPIKKIPTHDSNSYPTRTKPTKFNSNGPLSTPNCLTNTYRCNNQPLGCDPTPIIPNP